MAGGNPKDLEMAATLDELLDSLATKLPAIQSHLSSLDGPERVRQCRALNKRRQSRLYELAAEGGPLAPEDLLRPAADGRPGEPIRWYGKNSLPVFSHFEKHFVRQDGEVVGFNANWY